MKKIIRRSTKRYVLVSIVFLALMVAVGLGSYAIVYNNLSKSYNQKLEEKENELNSQSRKGYVAVVDLAAGDILANENVEFKTFYSSEPQEIFLSEGAIGKILLIDVQAETQITKQMITEQTIDKNLREVRYSEIELFSNISMNDWCDVRIVYPNGENYVVLSKKQIKNRTEDMQTFLWLNEEEIQLMSAAIVDCFLNSGSNLYVTKYISPTIQEETIVTYIPSLQTMQLIKDNPNIVNIASKYLSEVLRLGLEERLQESIEGNAVVAMNVLEAEAEKERERIKEEIDSYKTSNETSNDTASEDSGYLIAGEGAR